MKEKKKKRKLNQKEKKKTVCHKNFKVWKNMHFINTNTDNKRGCLRGVMVKEMDCEIVVSEFVLQWRYYVQFRTNTLGKGMNPLILPAMG